LTWHKGRENENQNIDYEAGTEFIPSGSDRLFAPIEGEVRRDLAAAVFNGPQWMFDEDE
jgi:hypothetical protein